MGRKGGGGRSRRADRGESAGGRAPGTPGPPPASGRRGRPGVPCRLCGRRLDPGGGGRGIGNGVCRRPDGHSVHRHPRVSGLRGVQTGVGGGRRRRHRVDRTDHGGARRRVGHPFRAGRRHEGRAVVSEVAARIADEALDALLLRPPVAVEPQAVFDRQGARRLLAGGPVRGRNPRHPTRRRHRVGVRRAAAREPGRGRMIRGPLLAALVWITGCVPVGRPPVGPDPAAPAGAEPVVVPSMPRAPRAADPSGSCPDDGRQAVLDAVNLIRGDRGLAPLRPERRLEAAAERHALDLARHQMRGHEGSDGSQPAGRASEAGYPWRLIGENVATGFIQPSTVVAGWMASPPHRENLLTPDFREAGVAYDGGDTSVGPVWVLVLGWRSESTGESGRCVGGSAGREPPSPAGR